MVLWSNDWDVSYIKNNTLCTKMYDILNLFYSISHEIETFLRPMLLIIFVFSEVLMCLSAFRLAYVSDKCGYITRINNLIFISHPATRNLTFITNNNPLHILEVPLFKKGDILPPDRRWNLEFLHSFRCVYELAN